MRNTESPLELLELEAAFFVKASVVLCAVQDDLVAASLLGCIGEAVDDANACACAFAGLVAQDFQTTQHTLSL